MERTAGDIGVQNLGAVGLSAWIYVFPTEKEVKGALVFTASNELGVNICWQGVNLKGPEIPRGKWFKISGSFNLADVKFKPGNKIQVYFWNTSSTDILIDDYFVVFGAPLERRGDSALVDLTKPAGYVPKFNYPPFPVSYLKKDSITSQIKADEIGREDLAVAGDFLSSGNEEMLVFRKDGKMAGYTFCREKNGFVRFAVTKPLQPLSNVKNIMAGKFTGNGTGQCLVVTDKIFQLFMLNPSGDPCSATQPAAAGLKMLSVAEPYTGAVYTGDFTGSGRAEVLVINSTGSWKIVGFEPVANGAGKWKTIAASEQHPVAAWNVQQFETGITAGSFLPGIRTDQLLSVSRSKSDRKITYTIYRFNKSGMNWESNYSGNGSGKIIGLDTLKPEDRFYTVKSDSGNHNTVFRYNRDWRFDLKEISFSDSAYAIRSGVDFEGYAKDYNPKYYESLRLIAGKFTPAAEASFLLIGKNAPERRYEAILPDFIHLYSVSSKK
jgi:hypothetical protein